MKKSVICRERRFYTIYFKNDTVDCCRFFFLLFCKVNKVEVVNLDLREESYDFLSEKKPTSH